MVVKIEVFEGEYAFLRNDYQTKVEYEGITFPTSEHAFQAAKSLDFEVRQSFLTTCSTPEEAIQRGHQIPLRSDWEDVKVDIMTAIVRNKFLGNEDLKEKLLATDGTVLLFGNTDHDVFWGYDLTIGDGLNRLGLILMTLRTELKSLSGLPVDKIDILEGAYYFLSNYYVVSVYYDGVTYPSSEHAYQAAKSLDPTVRQSFIQECENPDQAKKKGRQIDVRSDWDTVKVAVMTTIVRNKFMSHIFLAQKLLETGEAFLMEGNTWHDGFWGVDIVTGQGLNHLGKVLMTIRAELKSFMTIPAPTINTFDGDYFFLSNDYEAEVTLDDLLYPSNEHAFQAAKTTDPIIKKSFITECPTPDQAKKKGQQVALRPDWEQVKIYFMKKIVKNKFLAHPDLKDQLLATEDTILVEGNTRQDTFWGVDLQSQTGQNYLGLVLMEVRTELRVLEEDQLQAIDFFDGPYFFLCNFYEIPIAYEGVTYPSVEHAFQAAKSLDPTIRQSFLQECPTPELAKQKGRRIPLRPDWEVIKVEVMTTLIRHKFNAHPVLGSKLLATGDVQLIEGNGWNDTFWGVDLTSGIGLNHLGKILMKVRSELGKAIQDNH